MQKVLKLIVVLLITVGGLAACSLLQEPEEASGPIAAVPLEVAETEPEAEVETAPEAVEPADEDVEAAEEAGTAGEEVVPAAEAEETSSGGLTIFAINQEASTVRFELDEDLRGVRTTVIGETNQVAGEVAVDFANLSTTQVGVIQINARTLVTNNSFRNRALNNNILETEPFEFITFTPTAVHNLPDSVNIGDTVQFTVVGDLTIRDITHEVTFDLEVTAVSATELSGTASAVVTRTAYGLEIPSVRNVANVEDEVELTIEFTANAAS